MILCKSAFIAILDGMWPVGHLMDTAVPEDDKSLASMDRY